MPSEGIEELGDREPLDLSLSSASTKLDESTKSQFSSPASNGGGSGGTKIPLATAELPFQLNGTRNSFEIWNALKAVSFIFLLLLNSSSATLLQLYQMLTCVRLWRSGTVEQHPQQQIKTETDMTSSALPSIAPIPLPLIPTTGFLSTIPSFQRGIPVIDGLMGSEELKFSR